MILKIILELFDPLLISLIFILISFYYLIKHKNKYLFVIAIVVFYILNTSFITESLLYHYERQYPKIDLYQINKNHTVFVFGGGASNNEELPPSSKPKSESSIRLLEGMTLLNDNSTLILSGRNIVNGTSEAELIYSLSKEIKSDIKVKLDKESTNTEEQIKYISKLQYSQIILVSSASHIPRINYLAKKYELKNYLLAPTEYKVEDLDFELYDYLPSAKASFAMKKLIYELIAFSYTWIFV